MTDGQVEVFRPGQRETGCARDILLEFFDCSLKLNPAPITEYGLLHLRGGIYILHVSFPNAWTASIKPLSSRST